MYEEQIQTITAQVAEALAEQGLPFAPGPAGRRWSC